MFEKIKFNPRLWFLLLFISCAAMLSVGAYFQFVKELEPCPLCISQRIAILVTGILCLIGAIHNPKQLGIKIYAISSALTALIGAGISTRHVWIQNMPADEVPECGPGLAYVFEYFPLIETIKLMFSGTGECADVLWTLLGLSIPAWTLVTFLVLATISLLQIWNKPLHH